MKVSNRKKFKGAQQPTAGPALPSNLVQLTSQLRGRIIAQAYAKNGGKMNAAIREITGDTGHSGQFSDFGDETQIAFYEEIERIFQKADVDKDAAIRTLWAITTASIIDFVDDNGDVLPLTELRKLPRHLQAVLDRIEITRAYKPVRDEDGGYLFDPKTHQPILRPTVTCKIKMPEKTKAINTLASILHWIETRPQVTVNIAQVMKAADERADQMRTIVTDRTAGVPSTRRLDSGQVRAADDGADHALPEDGESPEVPAGED